MKFVKCQKTKLSLYQDLLKKYGYPNPINSNNKYSKYKKLLKDMPDNLITLLVKYFEDVKDYFPHLSYCHYPFPHPALLDNDDVVAFLKSLSKDRLLINGELEDLIEQAVIARNADYIVSIIKKGGYKRDEAIGTFVHVCRKAGVSPKEKFTKDVIEAIVSHLQRTDTDGHSM